MGMVGLGKKGEGSAGVSTEGCKMAQCANQGAHVMPDLDCPVVPTLLTTR